MRRNATLILPLLAYLVLALLLTYPLALHLTTHVPGDGIDDPALTWNLWWVKYALVNLHSNPFDCQWLFYPIGINLAFYTLTPLNGILSIPLQALHLVLASNLLLLSAFVLSGFGTYLLCRTVLGEGGRQQPGHVAAAFIAGLLYAFAANKLFYAALGQFNVASSQWIPFAALYLWRMARPPWRWRDALLAGLFLTFQAWAELTYASFLFIFIVLLMAWSLAHHVRSRAGSLYLLRNGLLVGLFAVAGLLPFLVNMVPDLLVEGDFFTSGGGFTDVFSADLAGYLLPTMHHPLLGGLVEGLRIPFDKGQQLYLGYVALALAALGFWSQRRREAARFWGVAFAAFFLLTLGPTLRINGSDTGVPLPFALIERLPFFKGNRYPSRYGVMLLLSTAMLVAWGIAALWQMERRRLVRALTPTLGALLLLEHLSIPLPLSDFRIPPIYQQIAADAGDFAVLELPLAWRNGARVLGRQDVIIMFVQWYQTAHGKRLLGGNTSRNPEFKFQYFAEAPLINSLIAAETDHPPDAVTQNRDRTIAPAVLATLNIRYVVAHLDRLPPDAITYLEATLPVERVAEEDRIRLYRVKPAETNALTNFDTADGATGRLHLGEGWSPTADAEGAAWAQRREVRLLLPITPDSHQLRLRLRAAGSEQRMTPVINGQALAPIALPQTWTEVTVTLRQADSLPPLSDVRLRFEKVYPAAGLNPDTDVGSTGIRLARNLLVSSAGLEVGDFGHITLDGQEVSPNGRGYNLVVVDPDDGEVVSRAVFDTHISVEASRQMVQFIEQVPQGFIVAGAVADEASMNLSEEAAQALHSLGTADTLRDRFRWSHAFIGVKGAPPGTALESVSQTRPARVFVGLPLSEPHVAAALSALELSP